MSIEIMIDGQVVHTVTEVDYDKKDFTGKILDYAESIKVSFSTASEIVDGLLHATDTYIEQSITENKKLRIEFVFDEEYKKELSNTEQGE